MARTFYIYYASHTTKRTGAATVRIEVLSNNQNPYEGKIYDTRKLIVNTYTESVHDMKRKARFMMTGMLHKIELGPPIDDPSSITIYDEIIIS